MPTVAGTMAFVTFVFFQAFNLLNVRDDRRSVFSHETLENRTAFVATAVVVLLVFVVEMDVLHGFLTTTDLPSGQWLACAAIGSAALWAGEVVKIVLRPAPGGAPHEPGSGMAESHIRRSPLPCRTERSGAVGRRRPNSRRRP